MYRGSAPSAVCGFDLRVSQQSIYSKAMLRGLALIKQPGSIEFIFRLLSSPYHR
jgi:hypothetical protein